MMRTVHLRTFFKAQTLKVEWAVDDISQSGSLESEIFCFYGMRWKLLLESKASPDRFLCDDIISVTLININSLEVHGRLSVESFIDGRDEQVLYCKHESFDTSHESSKRIWQMEEDFISLSLNSSLIKDGVLTLVFILTWKEDQTMKVKDEQGVQAHMNAESETSAERLAVDFRRLLDDSRHSDVTLKSGDITIPAHRLVLSARSDVFAAMLRSGMEESRTGVIEISDIDPPVLVQLVQFIYSGELSDLSMETAPQLFVAGDMYAIETLKNQCSAFMKENLDEGNACSILVLADAHGDMDLRERGISFIIDTELTQKDDIWLRFCDDHPKLAIEVLNRNLKAAKSFK